MYKILLLDLDDTILDFQKSEKVAISLLMKKYNVDPTEELIHRYHLINKKYWELFEQGKIEKSKLLVQRFDEFFNTLGYDNIDSEQVNKDYFEILSSVPFEIDGAYDFLEEASKNYEIYIITNGAVQVQSKRLSKVNVTRFFKKIYMSEAIGYQKPDVRYFEYVLKDLNLENKKDAVIIGDSISSDIQGGINIGIDTIWYNPNKKTSHVKSTYEVKNYQEILLILGSTGSI